MKVVTAEQMREIDRSAADSGLTTEILMENAGRAVAEETKNFLGSVIGKNILIFIGPGNNGGDGLVTARYLDDWGAEVSLYMCCKRPADDKNFTLTQERNITTIHSEQDKSYSGLKHSLASAEVVIDSIFGTGRSRSIEGTFKDVLMNVIAVKKNRHELFLIAVDMPSGLDANTGAVDPACPQADATITLGYPKPGLFNFPGAARAGEVIIADIGIPPALARDINTELITNNWVRSVLPARAGSANKGTFGKVLAVAGSINYIGAAYLACMGAARVGAGLVTLSTADSLQPILAAKLTEVTYAPLPESKAGLISSDAASVLQNHLPDYEVLLMGCGLGQSAGTTEFIKSILFNLPKTEPSVVVLDADALNTLAGVTEWWKKLGENVILTPHPGEMARLCGVSANEVQMDRLAIAQKAAAEWQKNIVLKGAYTVIAAPGGQVKISRIVNPGLASAGTGDVLTGIIAGLAAQGMSPFDAAASGVYIHGQAGNIIRQRMGDAGMLAGDLPPVIPEVLKTIKQEETPEDWED